MSYWQRVTIQDYIESQSATGAPVETWSDYAADVEARVLPLDVTESDEQWATPQEDAYEVQVRNAQSTYRPRMRVLVAGDAFEVRRVLQPPPFGTPTTILWTVRVTP